MEKRNPGKGVHMLELQICRGVAGRGCLKKLPGVGGQGKRGLGW